MVSAVSPLLPEPGPVALGPVASVAVHAAMAGQELQEPVAPGDGVVDHLARLVSLVGVSIPISWLATVPLALIYATLHWTVGAGRL